MTGKASGDSAYTAASIQVLEGIEAIRRRPGMYIGSTSSSGLHHLLWEGLDNAVDEAVAGFGRHIWVKIEREGWVSVTDEGRGMPFDPLLHQGQALPAATVILTVPHSGGKFEEGAYKTAGGLHGVGSTVINALSETLELVIWRDGREFRQTFRQGRPEPPHREVRPQKARDAPALALRLGALRRRRLLLV
jgi:DNA gyrase subunit B